MKTSCPVIDIHASWLALNPIHGCPFSCKYCFLNGVNLTSKKPLELVSPKEAVKSLLNFKFYNKKGQTKLSSIHAVNPSSLIHSFESIMDLKEYEKLIEEKTSTKEILQIALKIFNKNNKYSRIEIINEETGEIIDFIESTT